MDINTLKAINRGVMNAQEVIGLLAWENYPCGQCKDADLYEMFYQLNEMCITLFKKIHELEDANNEQKES